MLFYGNLILAVIILIVISFQDFKYRAISWYLPLVLGATLFFLKTDNEDVSATLIVIALNIVLLTVSIIGIVIYYSMKEKKLVNIFDTYIGWGDILMLYVFCFGFSFFNFILFYFLSLLLSIILYSTFLIIKKEIKLIPFAATMSISALIHISAISFFEFDSTIFQLSFFY